MRLPRALAATALLTLLLPGMATADGVCGRKFAEYTLDWTSNMENERHPSGVPTMAHAFSRIGPALPVALHYGGHTRRFEFDSPRVGDRGNGVMEIRHNLLRHDEFTEVEMRFDRNVHALAMTVHDFDEKIDFPRSYADRLVLEGRQHPDRGHTVKPSVSEFGKTARENQARREVRAFLGRPESAVIEPIHGQTFSQNAFTPITASFQEPVQKITVRLSSDPGAFSVRDTSANPGPQRIVLGHVQFCVPLDNS